ncbi:MAG: DUF262 domain-containing protein [Candidatus Melainabacteria bacterium]|nr:DUF262 domain-containing protein [Candidatus Melainabacteria bacterium]
MNIANEIAAKRTKVTVEKFTYDLSWITSKIESKQLTIAPSYQRTFEWTITQQSRFIESLALNLPVPPVYFAENADGAWELLDGLQRISTYLHFIGKTKYLTDIDRDKLNEESPEEDFELNEDDESNEEPTETENTVDTNNNVEYLELKGCDIVEGLNGKTYHSIDGKIQRRIENKPLDVYVFSYSKDDVWMRYHMFTRINAGGTKLSNQQLRNASIRLIDSKFIDFISNDLSKNKQFLNTIKLIKNPSTVKKNKGMFLEELVLRFFAFKNNRDLYQKDIAPFLTTYLEQCSAKIIKFNYEMEKKCFIDTFKFLAETCNKDSFKVNRTVNLNLYETVVLVIVSRIDRPNLISGITTEIINGFTKSRFFQKSAYVGGGKNTKDLLQVRLEGFSSYLDSARTG